MDRLLGASAKALPNLLEDILDIPQRLFCVMKGPERLPAWEWSQSTQGWRAEEIHREQGPWNEVPQKSFCVRFPVSQVHQILMAEASLISLLMLWVMEHLRKKERGTSLVVQWLRLCTYNAGCTGSVPDWGTKIPHASGHGQKKKRRRRRRKN